MAVVHFPGCTDKYPEKIETEPAGHIVEEDLGELGWPGQEVLRQCVDCGAYELVPRQKPTEPSPAEE